MSDISPEKRHTYWNTFGLDTTADDFHYHLSGADKDTTKAPLLPKALLHYAYRFALEAKMLQRFVKQYSGKTVLDVGTGTGRNALVFAEAGLAVDAIDLSEKFITENKKRFAEKKNISFTVQDVTQLALEKTYDIIFLGGVCMYLDNREMTALVERAKQHLNAGGVLITRDTLSRTETGYKDNKCYRSVADYTGVFAKSGATLVAQYNGPSRNIWVSLFSHLPMNMQQVLVLWRLFHVLMNFTIFIDQKIIMRKMQPFVRNKKSNQLFHIYQYETQL